MEAGENRYREDLVTLRNPMSRHDRCARRRRECPARGSRADARDCNAVLTPEGGLGGGRRSTESASPSTLAAWCQSAVRTTLSVPPDECLRLDHGQHLPPREELPQRHEREASGVISPPRLRLPFDVQGQLLPQEQVSAASWACDRTIEDVSENTSRTMRGLCEADG